MFTHVNHTSFFHSTLQRFDFHPSRNTSALCLKRCSQWRRRLATRPQRTAAVEVNAGIWAPLTWTRIQSADSDAVGLSVQAQPDGVVPGVAQNLPLLRPVPARHRALQTGDTVHLTQPVAGAQRRHPAPRETGVPATRFPPSTGWGRGGGCRPCGIPACGRCSVCCGWSAWCCPLTAARS